MKAKTSKQLLDWLYWMLDGRIVDSFCWEDEAQKIFRIPWPHGSSSTWTKEYCKPFELWAEHKGKLEDRKMDYKKLKATFRCALNSRKELKLVGKERNFRFWRIITNSDNGKEKFSSSSVVHRDGENILNMVHRTLPKTSKMGKDHSKKGAKIKVAKNASLMRVQTIENEQASRIQTSQSIEMIDEYKLPSFDSLKTFLPPSPPSEENIFNSQENNGQYFPLEIPNYELHEFSFSNALVHTSSNRPNTISAEYSDLFTHQHYVQERRPFSEAYEVYPTDYCLPTPGYQVNVNPTPPPDMFSESYPCDGDDLNIPWLSADILNNFSAFSDL